MAIDVHYTDVRTLYDSLFERHPSAHPVAALVFLIGLARTLEQQEVTTIDGIEEGLVEWQATHGVPNEENVRTWAELYGDPPGSFLNSRVPTRLILDMSVAHYTDRLSVDTGDDLKQAKYMLGKLAELKEYYNT